MSPAERQREHIQFSIRTLLILAVLVALLTPLCKWAWEILDDPLGVLASAGIGVAVGITNVVTLQRVPAGLSLILVLVVFDIVNGFWIPGGFPAYCCGFAAGGIIAWKGIRAMNVLLGLCGFTLSTPGRSHSGDDADGVGREQGPAHRVGGVAVHAGILGKPRHDRGAVKAGETGRETGEVEARRVRKAEEDLRIGRDDSEVEMRDQPNGIVATDAGDDAGNRRIGKRRHEVGGPRLGMCGNELGGGARVRHLDDGDAESLFELADSRLVTVREGTRSAP